MPKLSPAAQAVFEAARSAYWLKDKEQPADAELIAAAALRAVAAAHCESVEIRTGPGTGEIDVIVRESHIRAIAAELEAQSTGVPVNHGSRTNGPLITQGQAAPGTRSSKRGSHQS